MLFAELAIASHNFHDVHKQLPRSGVTFVTTTSKIKHSWRVALLPYLGEQELYDQYKFDEPWNSEANQRVLLQMPDVYRSPGQEEDSHFTSIAAFEGPNTPLGRSLEDIMDGTSRTILFVEAKTQIPWTKPEDLPYDSDASLDDLLELHDANILNAAFCDAAIHSMSPHKLGEAIHQFIQVNDGSTPSMEEYAVEMYSLQGN